MIRRRPRIDFRQLEPELEIMKTVIAALARGRCPHRGPWTSTQMPDISAAVVLKDDSAK